MDLIDLERLKVIIKKCNDLLVLCFDDEKEIIENIIKKHQNKINKYNNENLTVCDITTLENGLWKSTIKKVVYGKYYNNICDEKVICYDYVRNEYKDACNKTIFPDDLKLKNILLNRKIKNIYKLEPLEASLKNIIHTKILQIFQEQNKDLINKYI